MATDISPSITPTFDEVCPVADDGDYANHAALANMVRPALNRTAYLRDRADRKYVTPELHEDWINQVFDSSAGLLWGDSGPWSYSESSAGLVISVHGAVSGNDAGVLSVSNPTGSALSAKLAKAGRIPLSSLAAFTFRLDLPATPDPTAFEIGLFLAGTSVLGSGSTSGIAVAFDAAISPNIQTLGIGGGTYEYTDTGVPMTGSPTLFEVIFDGVAHRLYIDGAGPFDFNGLPAASATLIPTIKFGTLDAGTRQFLLDFFYTRWERTL